MLCLRNYDVIENAILLSVCMVQLSTWRGPGIEILVSTNKIL